MEVGVKEPLGVTGRSVLPAGLSDMTTGMTPPSKGNNEIFQDNFCLSGIGKAGRH